MSYTKIDFGRDLKEELSKGYNIVRISRRCYQIFLDHAGEMEKDLYDLLIELYTMQDDPQFEYSAEELFSLAERLINKEH